MHILLIFSGFIIVLVLLYEYRIRLIYKGRNKNKVHFYVARDKSGELYLWLGKPKRAVLSELWYGYNEITWLASTDEIYLYNLNPKDYDNLKWEDEPVEVFVNMGD